MSEKTEGFPKSDKTARKQSEDLGAEISEPAGNSLDRQISSKTGKRSSAQKLASSRPEFGSSPGANPVAGAFGSGQEEASKGEHQFRCNACGRWFETETEFTEHTPECRLAKEATLSGRDQLSRQDRESHEPGDRDSDKTPFLHRTKTS